MQKAIHFGAGKIGRGFIGAVLREAGFNVVFADVNQEVIDLINKEGRYTVQIRQTVAEIGPGAAFSKFSGIADEAAVAKVAEAYETIRLYITLNEN